jgi:hypothetical protein
VTLPRSPGNSVSIGRWIMAGASCISASAVAPAKSGGACPDPPIASRGSDQQIRSATTLMSGVPRAPCRYLDPQLFLHTLYEFVKSSLEVDK